MYKKDGIKIITISSFVLVLCLLIISLSTYALFSQSILVETHLQAGVLSAKLERTNLKYNDLNEEGLLVDLENEERIDFTKTNQKENNIFGLSQNKYIVPGSYFEATMVLTNEGNVAFDYWLEINVKEGSDTSLLNQIKVTVSTIVDEEIITITYLDNLIEIGSKLKPIDSVMNHESKTFIIKIEFVNNEDNNSAMEEEVNFDLTVYAVQKVNK